MKIVFLSLSILLSMSTNAMAVRAQDESVMTTQRRCGQPEITNLDRILVENELRGLRAQRGYRKFDATRTAPITIPIYFHVINRGSGVADGNVSDSDLKEQVQVMNETYAPMQIGFTLGGIDRTTNAKWMGASMFSTGETDMKTKLRQGDSTALNVYTTAATDGTLGWATFPWDYSNKPKMDGVVIHFQTLPNGALAAYNLGMTLVHEAGHWLGLYHTFQGGCNGGDSIADTPAEQGPNFGCPTSNLPDTCKADAGDDPIHNFMDYSDDVCLTDFSLGQIQRAHDSFDTYRTN
jgi:hypothetical protein